MAPTPGILYVTMQPQSSLPTAQFHDWYNNEHGPTRLRLPFIPNGFRYRATDLAGPGKGVPEWMAIYDITDTAELTKKPYTTLREDGVKSQREKEVMAQIKVDRRIYDLVETRQAEGFKPLEALDEAAEGNVLVAVSARVHLGKEKELDEWYRQEHMPMLSKVPGWLRTRRFVTSSIEGKGEDELEYLALHDYAPQNGLGGEEFKAATSTPRQKEIFTSVVREKSRRTYELYYTFGPTPRDLAPLAEKDAVSFTSPDSQTRTLPASQPGGPAIESYITTPDGVVLPYRLEGSTDPNAPLLLLSNSILVEWGIWDGFVSAFLSTPEGGKYRVLRYHTRGRSHACGEQPITLDVLASDAIALLDALRVPRAAALIGVSLGGATVLNAALKHPGRVAAFVACDTNAKSPESNRQAWGERIAVAEAEPDAKDEAGERVVGERLAEMTVRRWFVGESFDGGEMEKEVGRVKGMVERNSLVGFKRSVEALFGYDVREEMRGCRVRAAFLVGGGDGVLPGTMKEMAAGYGERAECVVVDGAGHLPMVEKPKEFTEFVRRFLNGR